VNETRRHASPDFCLFSSADRDRVAIARAPVAAAFFRDDRAPSFAKTALLGAFRARACWLNPRYRHRCRQSRPSQTLRPSGFTIIELMIVVVIVSILAMIAFPSYEDHLRKGRRSAAQNFLSDVATRQQQYLLDARQYAVGAGALAALNLTVPTDVAQFYAVTINPAAPVLPPAFALTATPLPGSRQVPDGALTLDSDGNKTRNGQPGWK
jgi:type IV pilus assembly protein PilE